MSAERAIRVAVVGAAGRMGRFTAGLLRGEPGFEVVAEIDEADDLGGALARARPDVGIDFTRAGLGFAHGAAMLGQGVRPLIGTSGVSLEENGRLDALARERSLGGLVVPNFSLGMWLLQRAAVEAAAHFGKAEIVEMHHERKKDAPSGTALDTAERMRAASARGGDPSQSPEVPIHSIRLPGLYAHQVVVLGAPGETYTLRHDMHGPEAFGPGIACAARYAASCAGVGRGIGAAFEWVLAAACFERSRH